MDDMNFVATNINYEAPSKIMFQVQQVIGLKKWRLKNWKNEIEIENWN